MSQHTDVGELKLSDRLLMAPGPTNLDPRVYQAMCVPMRGHLDPDFLKVMDDLKTQLRDVFVTSNELTFPVSGTGSAGMEAAMCSLLEPGELAIVTSAGFFGERLAEMGRRVGAEVLELKCEPGQVIDPQQVLDAGKGKDIKLVGLTHVETSTGVQHDVAAFSEVSRKLDALLVVDAVASLGGVPLRTDADGVDLCLTGSQKCLSAPPGLAPISASARAADVMANRKAPIAQWYLDLGQILRYWHNARSYHHTAPISMIYALREALRVVLEEGMEARWKRHADVRAHLEGGLQSLGLELFVAEPNRAGTVVAVRIPDGVQDVPVRQALLNNHDIEIAGGIGSLAGKIWRVGVMGASGTRENVDRVLDALKESLAS